jgi:hypothetical protein
MTVERFASQIHATELIPNGWTVVEDIEPTRDLDIEKLECIGVLEGNEEYIGAKEMRERAVKLEGNLGLSDAKHLLAKQTKIPVEFRKHYILLPGTVLRDADGYGNIPCIGWRGHRWGHSFLLGGRFGSLFCFVRSK